MLNKEYDVILSRVSAERMDKDSLRISWQPSLNGRTITVYMGDSLAGIDNTKPAAEVSGGTHVDLTGLNPGLRYFFAVVPENGKAVITAERGVPFEGAVNFRDLGGYSTEDGHRVKWNQVFRADTLGHLTKKDQILFKEMEIRTVCDFRSDYEVALAPDKLPEDDSVNYVQLPILHGDFGALKALDKLEESDAKDAFIKYLKEGYIKSIEDFAPVWSDMINLLADSKNQPMVLHCTSGKDRTGTGAALILLALGVPEETVSYDYSLSGPFISRRLEAYSRNIGKLGLDPKRVVPMRATPPEYIQPFLEHMRKAYGSAEHYLTSAAGVREETLTRLKELLLE